MVTPVPHVKMDMFLEVRGKDHLVQVMLDSGATGNFIDHGMVNTLQIPLMKKDTPEEVQAVDGKPLSSGPLTEHTTVLQLRMVVGEEHHIEGVRFNVIDAPQYGIILGMPWLQQHNPLINWVRSEERRVGKRV